MRATGVALLGLWLLMTVGCSENGADGGDARTRVTLTFAGMMDEQRMFIENNGMLELWMVTGTERTSLGLFTIDFNGRPLDASGILIEAFEAPSDLSQATRLAVTFETEEDAKSPQNGQGPELLSGLIDGDTFEITFAGGYNGILGQYLIVTPSDGGGTPDAQDEDSTNPFCGIWFSARDWGKPGVGLGLALPPDGWTYEGWIMNAPMSFLSTGRFDSVNALDGQNAYLSSVDPGNVAENYHFPGEDFLTNAPEGLTFPLDLRGLMTFVTLEPEPDFDPDHPFLIMTLFCKTIPAEVESTIKSQPLDAPPLPRATAILR